MTTSAGPVLLRGGTRIADPALVVLGIVQAHRFFDLDEPARPASFGEPDLRLANRGGARISAAQIAAILERQPVIEAALREIAPGAALAGPGSVVPWPALGQLFG